MNKSLFIPLSVVIGLIGAAFIVSKPWVTIQHAEPITVKGYAEQDVLADRGSLTIRVEEREETNAQAYENAGKSLDQVMELIGELLGEDLDIKELSTSINEIKKLNEKGLRTNEIEFYEASRSLRVNTEKVEELAVLSRKLYDLNSKGVQLTQRGPDFFVSGLNEVKLELMERATKNGHERAEIMAESSGEKLGSLVSAKQGVIQITKPNSSATSSYGMYDTETIDKVVKLVVTLEYKIGG
jgi:hypothetical protein|tara:strand:+ start:560 stop:1282 length:723 start_codon:yes stop_codon:yes gene_type:complete